MRKYGFVVAGALGLLGLAAPAAHANGRFPAANQLVVAPSDPSLLVLRTTFGVLLSHDTGATWDWICEAAVGYNGVQDPPIGITAKGAVVAGMFEGLGVSTDSGCSWGFAGGAIKNQPIVDLVVRPDAPHTILALTNAYSGNTDAGDPTFTSQVFLSTDDGAHWAKQGVPIDPTYILETIEVAASDPQRLYASGVRGSGTTSTGALFVSTNAGASWTTRSVPIDPSIERAPFVAGVDPTNADRVYVRTSGTSSNRLLVTANAGQSFTPAYEGKLLLGFAQSADGSTIYVGGPQDGLLVAARADMVFKKRSSTAVQCLAVRGATIYACSNEASGFILGASTDDGATFAPKLHLSKGIRGPLACGADASAAVCVEKWPALRDQLGIGGDDAGPQADAGQPLADAGTPTPPPAGSKSCGCGSAPGDGEGALCIAGTTFALLLAMRGRRRRRDAA